MTRTEASLFIDMNLPNFFFVFILHSAILYRNSCIEAINTYIYTTHYLTSILWINKWSMFARLFSSFDVSKYSLYIFATIFIVFFLKCVFLDFFSSFPLYCFEYYWLLHVFFHPNAVQYTILSQLYHKDQLT